MTDLEEIQRQINRISLAPSARLALSKATEDVFNQMKQKEVIQASPLSRRIATAAFLACDSKACIALPKLKSAFGNQIAQKQIVKVRAALQIPHGTAHEKLNSLLEVAGISNTSIISQAHHYADLLGESGMPTSIAATALYLASFLGSTKERLTERDIFKLTGCTEVTQRKLLQILLRKEK